MKDTIPRRNRLDQMTSAELAIYNAMGEVEKAGADIRLTEAVILLRQAGVKVADFVDGVSEEAQDATQSRSDKLVEIYKLLSKAQEEQIASLKNYVKHLGGSV